MTDVTSSEGALSLDQAVELMAVEPEAPAVEAAPEEQPEIEAPPPEAEDASEAEQPGDGEENAEEAEPVEAVAAPAWWTAEEKAAFAEVPAHVQAIIAATEGRREQVVSTAKQEAAEARKMADKELAGTATLAEQLGTFLPQALEAFKDRWEGIDWVALPAQVGAEKAFELKAQHDEQKALVIQTVQAQKAADTLAHQNFVKTEMAKLETLEPDLKLADPKEGPALRGQVADYLMGQGVPGEAIRQISAVEMVIARKAMLYDKGKAASKNPAPKPAPATLKPSSPQTEKPQSREIDRLKNRLSQTRSLDDAVALMVAKGM